MKRTSKELMEWLGLKLGDRVQVSGGFLNIYEVVSEGVVYMLKNESDFFDDFQILVDKEFTIIKPLPKLTEDEKFILRNVEEDCEFITRDGAECLSVHLDCPYREENRWSNTIDFPFDRLFQFIKWEDEPYKISELLGEKDE